MKKNKQIYLSWNSFNGGFSVAAKAIELLAANESIHIDEIIYLHDNPLSNESIAEKKAFLQEDSIGNLVKKFKDAPRTKSRIIKCADIGERLDRTPKFENRIIHINSVTDYQSIFDNLIPFIKNNINTKENFDLHINVSPGTPQMHVVWLMLNSTGFLPTNTKLWSTQYVKSNDKTILKSINFKPKTILSQVFKSQHERKHPITINPNETISSKRQETEKKIRLFSTIPNAPLLLLGERGVGKSTYVRNLIAANIDAPYKELACGTFSENLIRSELFGHKKGAFTGAITDKKGILDFFTDGGILFLDEIHDLSKPLQRNLIQVLQTGEYYPIGEHKAKKAQFKLVTASNLTISELQKKLDGDFMDRISRFIVQIPPLRECKEDLSTYWSKSWGELSDFEAAPPLLWNQKIETYLKKQDLHGNFRDIQKLISYLMAFLLSGENKLEAFKLAKIEFEQWKSSKTGSAEENNYFKNGKSYREMADHFNFDLVTWAKQQYGDLDAAEKILNRAKSTLYEDLRGGKK